MKWCKEAAVVKIKDSNGRATQLHGPWMKSESSIKSCFNTVFTAVNSCPRLKKQGPPKVTQEVEYLLPVINNKLQRLDPLSVHEGNKDFQNHQGTWVREWEKQGPPKVTQEVEELLSVINNKLQRLDPLSVHEGNKDFQNHQGKWVCEWEKSDQISLGDSQGQPNLYQLKELNAGMLAVQRAFNEPITISNSLEANEKSVDLVIATRPVGAKTLTSARTSVDRCRAAVDRRRRRLVRNFPATFSGSKTTGRFASRRRTKPPGFRLHLLRFQRPSVTSSGIGEGISRVAWEEKPGFLEKELTDPILLGAGTVSRICLDGLVACSMSEEVVSPRNGSSGSRSRVGISNDNPSLQISPVKFDSNNFLAWSRSCLLFIQARGLYGYVIGSKSKPADGDPLLEPWISENSLVMSWLINSMQPQISRGYLLLDSADKMWTALCQTYSQVGNDIQVFELRKKLHETKQGELTIAQYFAELSGLWQELDYYQEYQPVHPADAASYKKVVDKERVYDFLAGLNLEYDQIRVQVLGRDPFPNLRQTYAYVHQEESRRIAMLHVVTRERSAMVATPIPKESKGVHTRGIEIARGSDNDDLQCDYCGKTRHTRDTCWKLHGRPTRGRGGRFVGPPRSRAHVSDTVESSPSTESSALNAEEMQHLRRLMAKLDGCPSTSAASSHHAPSHHALGTHSTTDSEPWIIDSGASDHMTGTSRNFSTYFPCSGKDKVRVADGSLSTISGKGSIQCTPTLPLSSVLHIPKFSMNLLSISSITRDLNCQAILDSSCCKFQELGTGRTIGYGKEQDGLYLLEYGPSILANTVDTVASSQSLQSSAFITSQQQLVQWHRRLGHPSFLVLGNMFPDLLKHCTMNNLLCDACEFAKHKRASYPLLNNKSTTPFALIHSDVWGPSRVVSLSGYKWFVTFIDCFSRTTWVYLLRAKNEVFTCFQMFHKLVCTQFDGKVKILRSDNGTEYTEGNFQKYLRDHIIMHQTSCVDTSAQNGTAERKNRHLLEVAQSLMFTMNVPKAYWGDAVLSAAYLINRMSLRTLDFNTHLDVLQGKCSFVVPPKVFGCACFVHEHGKNISKLDHRALKWESNSEEEVSYGSKGEWLPELLIEDRMKEKEDEAKQDESILEEVRNNEIHTRLAKPDLLKYSRRCRQHGKIAIETALPSQEFSPDPASMPVHPCKSPDAIPSSNTPHDSPVIDDTNLPIAIRKAVRTCTHHPISNHVSYKSLSPSYRAFVSTLSSVSIPQDWKEALADPKWEDAMVEEMKALSKNDTWELASLPHGKRAVGCKWVFTIKRKADGTIKRYKARLVARGFTQTYGVDYQETFAPVAKMNSIRVLISCAANLGWDLQQLDIKNAFLHGDLAEEVYMEIPLGFSCQKTEGKVCKLKKSLYGLKQSPRAWFDRFQKAMISFGYQQSNADHTMFVKHCHGKDYYPYCLC
ncbi:Retrovirus-related Pol polyprotein from transposon TNT 1-94 [Quillaja saponaria]|uniref:Retrovirus-related Pol polyprotein from transposon TNT 1-94 n=1 Tax=Quillaja saponaria TaxID=32244 RepID=A0AAD7L343_QUISA|nr:Retrovirus-related Pol polyprotein from transposon TNT 1-94 [Quillaja saponaria]